MCSTRRAISSAAATGPWSSSTASTPRRARRTSTPIRGYERYDAARLKLLLERHVHYTDSARARDILADWERHAGRFVKVLPVDFRRAVRAMAIAGQRPAVTTEAAAE